jgi:hypothetical protein
VILEIPTLFLEPGSLLSNGLDVVEVPRAQQPPKILVGFLQLLAAGIGTQREW